jgi:hypothetical protein
MVPFQEYGNRQCPACGNPHMTTMWQTICEGGRSFLLDRGYWFFGWRGGKTFECKIKGPKHLHMKCESCQHQWMMLTGLDRHMKILPVVETDPTKPKPTVPTDGAMRLA